MERRKADEPQMLYRSFELDRATVDKDKRTVAVSFSSETPVDRWYMPEILLHGDKNVDLSRLRNMGAALLNHNPSMIVGPLSNIRLEDRRGMAVIKFDDDEDGERAFKKVKSGSLKGVSVGYVIQKAREIRKDEEWADESTKKNYKGPAFIATRWTPYEISLTPIPADATVGVNRALDGIDIERATNNQGESIMSEEEIRKLIDQAVKKGLEAVTRDLADQTTTIVRDTITEMNRPKMNVTVEQSRELLARAGAVSLEVKSEVADLVNDGNTNEEIQRFILEKATGEPDASDAGDIGNGLNQQSSRGNVIPMQYKKASDMPDEEFVRMVVNPAQMPMI